MAVGLAYDNGHSLDRFAGHCGAKDGCGLTADVWVD